ncbi:hypothetical protein BJ166DRAFT_583379 [Pestalotiopsis sp. NC0098]|nr:hypothetical protein BJ166DRAFT_583379 [Pestalotiopsis sp. NC0098]
MCKFQCDSTGVDVSMTLQMRLESLPFDMSEGPRYLILACFLFLLLAPCLHVNFGSKASRFFPNRHMEKTRLVRHKQASSSTSSISNRDNAGHSGDGRLMKPPYLHGKQSWCATMRNLELVRQAHLSEATAGTKMLQGPCDSRCRESHDKINGDRNGAAQSTNPVIPLMDDNRTAKRSRSALHYRTQKPKGICPAMGRFVTRGLTSYNKKVRLPTYVATYENGVQPMGLDMSAYIFASSTPRGTKPQVLSYLARSYPVSCRMSWPARNMGRIAAPALKAANPLAGASSPSSAVLLLGPHQSSFVPVPWELCPPL